MEMSYITTKCLLPLQNQTKNPKNSAICFQRLFFSIKIAMCVNIFFSFSIPEQESQVHKVFPGEV